MTVTKYAFIDGESRYSLRASVYKKNKRSSCTGLSHKLSFVQYDIFLRVVIDLLQNRPGFRKSK